jgi:hypothetical protein
VPKPDEVVTEVAGVTIFKKSDSEEYEIVGPAVDHSPLSYTMIRATPEKLEKILRAVRGHQRNGR